MRPVSKSVSTAASKMSSFATVIALAAGLAVTYAALPANYESLSAVKKQDILWGKISANPYPDDQLPTQGHGALESLNLFRSAFDQQAFLWNGDEMIKGRPKLVHTYGTAAKVELQVYSSSKYTGVFSPGNKAGISRISRAILDDKMFVPGMATKILIDGKPSVNLFSMNGIDGQGKDKNIFKLPFTNFIPDPAGVAQKLLASKFREASDDLPGGVCDRPLTESKMPLLGAASQNVSGTVIAKPNAPLVWHLTPNTALGWDGSDPTDYRLQLAKIAVDSVLYTVAVSTTEGGPKETIGKLVLKSNFVASDYEDSTLFFKHPIKHC